MAGQQAPRDSPGGTGTSQSSGWGQEKPEFEDGRERAHERDFNNINGIRIPRTGKQ